MPGSSAGSASCSISRRPPSGSGLCHPPPRGHAELVDDPGAARACEPGDDADLHPTSARIGWRRWWRGFDGAASHRPGPCHLGCKIVKPHRPSRIVTDTHQHVSDRIVKDRPGFFFWPGWWRGFEGAASHRPRPCPLGCKIVKPHRPSRVVTDTHQHVSDHIVKDRPGFFFSVLRTMNIRVYFHTDAPTSTSNSTCPPVYNHEAEGNVRCPSCLVYSYGKRRSYLFPEK